VQLAEPLLDARDQRRGLFLTQGMPIVEPQAGLAGVAVNGEQIVHRLHHGDCFGILGIQL
jgi:hypothetical protein